MAKDSKEVQAKQTKDVQAKPEEKRERGKPEAAAAATAGAATAGAEGEKAAAPRKRRERRVIPRGTAHVKASFNNTIVSIADPEGTSSRGRPPARPVGRARARALPTPRRSPGRTRRARRSTRA